jgi:hypothetical protein
MSKHADIQEPVGTKNVRVAVVKAKNLGYAPDLGVKRKSLAIPQKIGFLYLTGKKEILHGTYSSTEAEKSGRTFLNFYVNV